MYSNLKYLSHFTSIPETDKKWLHISCAHVHTCVVGKALIFLPQTAESRDPSRSCTGQLLNSKYLLSVIALSLHASSSQPLASTHTYGVP